MTGCVCGVFWSKEVLLFPNLAAAAHDVFAGRQFFQAHWTARVEFLVGDADLRAEAKFKAVRKARRGVDVDGGAVYGVG